MLGMFCGTNVTNDEMYKQCVKRKITISAVLTVVGIITLAIALLAKSYWQVNIEERILSFYCGVGSGLSVAGIVLLIKNILLLKDDQKLRQSRISMSDERNKEVSTLATKVAVAAMLVVTYLVMLIGGLWYPILIKAGTLIIAAFLLGYCIAYKIISKRI